MLSVIFKHRIYLFIAAVMLTGFSPAQDKNNGQGAQNMNMNHMEMDHSRMMQNSDSTSFDLQAIDENNDGKVYQCPMDYDVLSDKPGKCSKCGMKLKEASLKTAADHLTKKGFSVKGEETSSTVREGVIDLNAIDANKDGMVYQDMMDYNVVSDAPGTCPLCGMTLKEVSLKEAKMYLEKTGYKVS